MGVQRRTRPEEEELQRKQAELVELEGRLAEQELELATLRAELSAFERHYAIQMGARYATLDELHAQIAEAAARLRPADEACGARARAAREQAAETARAAEACSERGVESRFAPTETLKELYREAAKTLHPDLAESDSERERRHRFMVAANEAYAAGDEARLRQVLEEWGASSESVRGEGVAADLVRVIRKLARVRERLASIEAELLVTVHPFAAA